MFNRKKCKKCGDKISDKYEFCPNCGTRIDENPKDWGMLGKNDIPQEENPFQNSLLGGAGFGMLNKMLGNAMKMLEKEMQKEVNQNDVNSTKQNPKTNFELFINGKRIDPKNIKISQKQIPINEKNSINQQINENKTPEIELKRFDKDQQKKFSKLSQEEPQTNIRRLSNKIIYELKVPGVKSIEDVSIAKLENSIEIKAITKEKAYFKLIQIKLPILKYELKENNLVLELAEK